MMSSKREGVRQEGGCGDRWCKGCVWELRVSAWCDRQKHRQEGRLKGSRFSDHSIRRYQTQSAATSPAATSLFTPAHQMSRRLLDSSK